MGKWRLLLGRVTLCRNLDVLGDEKEHYLEDWRSKREGFPKLQLPQACLWIDGQDGDIGARYLKSQSERGPPILLAAQVTTKIGGWALLCAEHGWLIAPAAVFLDLLLLAYWGRLPQALLSTWLSVAGPVLPRFWHEDSPEPWPNLSWNCTVSETLLSSPPSPPPSKVPDLLMASSPSLPPSPPPFYLLQAFPPNKSLTRLIQSSHLLLGGPTPTTAIDAHVSLCLLATLFRLEDLPF